MVDVGAASKRSSALNVHAISSSQPPTSKPESKGSRGKSKKDKNASQANI